MAVLISSCQKLMCSSIITKINQKTMLGDTFNLLYENDNLIACRTGAILPMGIAKRSYSGRQLVGYTMEQMYDVVSDVENYEKFVPWCKRSIVTDRKPSHMMVDLIIGFPPITEKYTSIVRFEKPTHIKAESTTGILFNYLVTNWNFSPGLKTIKQSCVIDFSVSFEFKSALHSQLANVFFNKVVNKMEDAFLLEAGRRYGKASLNTLPLRITETTL